MFLDASAIIAILTREPDAGALAARLGQAAKVHISPVVAYEAAVGIARVKNIAIADAKDVLDAFLAELSADIVTITRERGELAIAAFERFGKGRHKAALNLGDCFAYACAKDLGVPLLFKGDDFPHTDIEVA